MFLELYLFTFDGRCLNGARIDQQKTENLGEKKKNNTNQEPRALWH